MTTRNDDIADLADAVWDAAVAASEVTAVISAVAEAARSATALSTQADGSITEERLASLATQAAAAAATSRTVLEKTIDTWTAAKAARDARRKVSGPQIINC